MSRRRKRVAAIVAVAAVVMGGVAPVAAGAEAPARGSVGTVTAPLAPVAGNAGVASAGSSRCPASVSCGFGCTATLATSVCILSISWTTGARVGGVQIGPSFRFECTICECWYRYTSSNGNQLFRRTTDGSCHADFPGLILR